MFMATKAILFFPVSLFLLLQKTEGTYRLEVRAHSYSNPRHKVSNGYCCEISRRRNCDPSYCRHCQCDNRFNFCLRQSGTVHDDNTGNCPLGSYSTGEVGDDSFNFGTSNIASGVPNPMIFTGSVWPGGFQLYIRVTDVDIRNDDHVDDVYIDISLSPSSSFTSSQVYNGDHGNSRIYLSFRVTCSSNYYGGNCTTYCVSTDSASGHYTCGSNGEKICRAGWSGPAGNCLTPICAASCHDVGGTCNVPGGCTCRPGWTGDNCDQCIPSSTCSPIGGYCNLPGQCNCQQGYQGFNCEIDLQPCLRQTLCNNGATCIDDGRGGYTCTCLPGYTGINCQNETNDCDPNPCHSGGSCTDMLNGYRCDCAIGFNGTNCETNIDDCGPDRCENEGICQDLVNDYSCDCNNGWTGRNCEIDINECDITSACVQGSCTDLVNDYSCDCNNGWTGRNCEIDINECNITSVCVQGSCTNQLGSYNCSCHVGWTGQNCDINIDGCSVDSCRNGGTCLDGRDDDEYFCLCEPDYTGLNCESNLANIQNHMKDGANSNTTVVVVVSIVIVCLVILVALIIIISIVFYVKRQLKISTATIYDDPSVMDNPAYDSKPSYDRLNRPDLSVNPTSDGNGYMTIPEDDNRKVFANSKEDPRQLKISTATIYDDPSAMDNPVYDEPISLKRPDLSVNPTGDENGYMTIPGDDNRNVFAYSKEVPSQLKISTATIYDDPSAMDNPVYDSEPSYDRLKRPYLNVNSTGDGNGYMTIPGDNNCKVFANSKEDPMLYSPLYSTLQN